MEHHDLDIYPIPREKTALYINEPSGINCRIEME